MRKAVIIISIGLWLLAGVSILVSRRESTGEEQGVVSAFGANTFSEISTWVEGFGHYQGDIVSAADREEVLRLVAEKIGINQYSIAMKKDSERVTAILTQQSINGDVEIRLVTFEENQNVGESYLFINLNLKHNIDSAISYKKLVTDIYRSMGIAPEVTVYVEGTVNGYLDYASKNVLTDSFLNKIDANIISENRSSEFFVIYGYTHSIQDYMQVEGEKINVSLSIEYNEENDTTRVRMATPVESFNQ